MLYGTFLPKLCPFQTPTQNLKEFANLDQEIHAPGLAKESPLKDHKALERTLLPPPNFYLQKRNPECCGCLPTATKGIYFLKLQVLNLSFYYTFFTNLKRTGGVKALLPGQKLH